MSKLYLQFIVFIAGVYLFVFGFSKQLTMENHCNTFNDQVVDIRAKNLDQHGLLFHSHFYRMVHLSPALSNTSSTPSATPRFASTLVNFITFRDTVVNQPSLRALLLHNVTSAPLVLQFGIQSVVGASVELCTIASHTDDVLSGSTPRIESGFGSTGQLTDIGVEERGRLGCFDDESGIIEIFQEQYTELQPVNMSIGGVAGVRDEDYMGQFQTMLSHTMSQLGESSLFRSLLIAEEISTTVCRQIFIIVNYCLILSYLYFGSNISPRVLSTMHPRKYLCKRCVMGYNVALVHSFMNTFFIYEAGSHSETRV